jgi:hypothetical protein
LQPDYTNYYPAAVYLGPSQSSNLFRILDTDAADLINRAALSANSGFLVPLPKVRHLYATGTTNEITTGGTTADYAQLQVNTGPIEALRAGGGWFVNSSTIVHTGLNDRATITGNSTIDVNFQCTLDHSFGLPYRRPGQLVQVLTDGATYIIDMPYMAPPAPYSLSIDSKGIITLVNASTRYSYQLLYSDNLTSPIAWQALISSPTAVFDGVTPIIFSDPAFGQAQTRFYRAQWVDCPP